jgi:hypothetical protein
MKNDLDGTFRRDDGKLGKNGRAHEALAIHGSGENEWPIERVGRR